MLDKIFEINKNGNTRFVEMLKRGNKKNLDIYFDFAKKNNINLFEYNIGKELPLIAIFKYISKTTTEKTDVEIDYFIQNGFNIFIENFKDKTDKYPYFDFSTIRKIENEYSVAKSIYLQKIIKKNLDIKYLMDIKEPEKLLNLIQMEKLNYIKEEILKHVEIKNPFLLNAYNLLKIVKNNKKIKIEQSYIEEFKKDNISKNVIDHLIIDLTDNTHSNILLKIAKKDLSIFDKISPIILSYKKFNEEIVEKHTTEEYEKATQYPFFRNGDYRSFFNYLNKIVEFNEHYPNNAIKLPLPLSNGANFLNIANFSLEKTTPNFFYTMKIYNKSDKNFLEKLELLNIKNEDNLVLNLFEKKSLLNKFIEHYYSPSEIKNLVDNFISDEDIKNNIHNINVFDNNSKNFATINLNINFLLEKTPEVIFDFLSKKNLKVKLTLMNNSMNVFKKYTENEVFKNNDFLDIFFNNEDYKKIRLEYINTENIESFIINYLSNIKGININKIQKETIKKFSNEFYENEKINFLNKERMLLSLSVYDNIKTPKRVKRL